MGLGDTTGTAVPPLALHLVLYQYQAWDYILMTNQLPALKYLERHKCLLCFQSEIIAGDLKANGGKNQINTGVKEEAKLTIFRSFLQPSTVTLAADYSKWTGGVENNIKRGLLKRCLNDLIHPPATLRANRAQRTVFTLIRGGGARLQRVLSQFGAGPRRWHQFILHKKASAGGWFRVRVTYSYSYRVLWDSKDWTIT